MKQLSMMDKGFLLAESRETPMHVGGVSLYTLPEGANEQTFLHELAANIRDARELVPPFGDRLKTGLLGLAGDTFWQPDPALDLDYHVRHSALPQPGRYRELFTLVSRLHSTLLDRNRPLWEMHLIEGLKNRQFAVYTKTHHAAVDGARSMHLARSMLSEDPQHVLDESPLSLASWEQYKYGLSMGKQPAHSEADLRNVADRIKATFDTSADLYQAIKNGSATVVTDTIETVTESGINLSSGDQLEADIIVTATGLKLSVLSDIPFTVDGDKPTGQPEGILALHVTQVDQAHPRVIQWH